MLEYYTFVPRNFHAAFYYRVFVPFHTARDLGIPARVHVDTNDAGIDPEERVKRFFESDVVLLYHPAHSGVVHNARRAKAIIPSKIDGKWKYPPSIVIETDDNLFDVSPHNPAFGGLGWRLPDGKPIPYGQSIGVSEGGMKRLLWHSGECGPNCRQPGEKCPNRTDFARNRQSIESYRAMLNLADAISCTTPRVAAAVRENSKARRTRVFPNLVRFDHYEQVDLVRDPSRLTILWQGGSAHYEDWHPLREQLGAITKKYPHVHWKIWGQLYPWVTELIPPDRYTHIDWCPYPEYKLRLAMMGHDINLAPLAPNKFNDCRSAIKVYEASVLKRDIPTVAQATGPYKDEFVDGETAMLFDTPEEFGEKLSTLIENESLRLEIGRNAKDWVHQNRDAFKEVPKQFAFFEELRELAPREQPHMPEEQWAEFEERMRQEEAAVEQVPVEA